MWHRLPEECASKTLETRVLVIGRPDYEKESITGKFPNCARFKAMKNLM
jgi:hypothetical protein